MRRGGISWIAHNPVNVLIYTPEYILKLNIFVMPLTKATCSDHVSRLEVGVFAHGLSLGSVQNEVAVRTEKSKSEDRLKSIMTSVTMVV